jgi:hypothetical protein
MFDYRENPWNSNEPNVGYGASNPYASDQKGGYGAIPYQLNIGDFNSHSPGGSAPIITHFLDPSTEKTFTLTTPRFPHQNYESNKNGFWKYNEDKILKELEQYISSTYSQHYVDRTGGGKEQTLDKIKHNRREGFCAGNVTKYIDRYDTKGTPRADLFKVLHYTILLINHLNLIENK